VPETVTLASKLCFSHFAFGIQGEKFVQNAQVNGRDPQHNWKGTTELSINEVRNENPKKPPKKTSTTDVIRQ
jgi:hypothetical protein